MLKIYHTIFGNGSGWGLLRINSTDEDCNVWLKALVKPRIWHSPIGKNWTVFSASFQAWRGRKIRCWLDYPFKFSLAKRGPCRNKEYVKQVFINTHLHHESHYSRIINEALSCFIVSCISLFGHVSKLIYSPLLSCAYIMHLTNAHFTEHIWIWELVISWWLYHDQLCKTWHLGHIYVLCIGKNMSKHGPVVNCTRRLFVFQMQYFRQSFSCREQETRRFQLCSLNTLCSEALIIASPPVLPAQPCGLSFAVRYCTAQQAQSTPVAPTAAACTTAFLSVALEHQTKHHVAQRGLIELHKPWLCRNFDVLWNGSWVRTAGKEEVQKITVLCALNWKVTDLTWAKITVWRISVLPRVERVMSNTAHFPPALFPSYIWGLSLTFRVLKLLIFDH